MTLKIYKPIRQKALFFYTTKDFPNQTDKFLYTSERLHTAKFFKKKEIQNYEPTPHTSY